MSPPRHQPPPEPSTSDDASAQLEVSVTSAVAAPRVHGESRARGESLEQAFIKARIKARLLGHADRVRIDRFELVQRLGQGAEGTVYEARDTDADSRVALKQLHPAYASAGASLKGEFRALADLVHPNLVVLHELFHVHEQWFYTMELVEGVDFVSYARAQVARASEDGCDAEVPASQAAPPRSSCNERLRAALSQLLTGLDALHAAGMIHRDLKPSNVLVRANGHVVILDYGLVIDHASLRAPAQDGEARSPREVALAGTPAYAAPEQVAGHVEPASDLYAVGVMLYQALTGELPFTGSVTTLLAQKRVGDTHAPAVDVLTRTDLPADLAALCCALLEVDPARRPSAAQARAQCNTAQLDTREHAPSFVRGAAPGERFVGRQALLAELHALTTARGDAPLLVLLRGESGIGKTALLRRFCAERAQAGALVLEGRCYEREHLPFKALDAIVEQLVQHLHALPAAHAVALPVAQREALVRLLPGFARLEVQVAEPDHAARGEPGSRLHAFAAVRALFQALARQHEVVFAVDDLQWGDLDSIDLLRHLFSGRHAPPIVLIGIYRAEERETSPVMQAIVHGDALSDARLRRVELTVGPLARDEAGALFRALASSGRALSERELDACIAQASGLPFAIHQIATYAHEPAPDPRPEAQLGDVVRQRVERCSSAARGLLQVLCVAGRPLETQLALRSSGGQRATWSEAAELCGRKLARWRETEHARCLEPYHDLVRTAVVQGIGPSALRAVHAAIVDALEALRPDHPEHMVEHLLGAGELERAGAMALVAAERAGAQLAWNRAADLLRVAQRTLPAAQQRSHGVTEKLGLALSAANRHRESAAAYLEAAAATDVVSERRRLEGLAAQQQMRAGDYDAGTARIRGLLGELGYRLPRSVWGARWLWVLHRLRMRVSRWLKSERPASARRSVVSEARMRILAAAYAEVSAHDLLSSGIIHGWGLREARHARDAHMLRALASEAVHLAVRYGPRASARVKRLLSEVDALLPTEAPQTAYDHALREVAHALYLQHCVWRPRDALVRLAAADAHYARDCPGTDFERSWVLAMQQFAWELAGECGALRDDVLARLHHSEDYDDGYSKEQLLMSVPLVHMLCDDPAAALAFVADKWTPPDTFRLVDYTVVVRVSSVLLYRGDAVAASAVLLDAWPSLRRSGLLYMHMIAENAWYHRARNAAALYAHTRAPEQRRLAMRIAVKARRYPPALRAMYRLIEATISCIDGNDRGSRAALQATIDDSVLDGAGTTEWCARYRLAQLDGDAEGLDAASAWLRARGVSHPERWVAVSAPGACWHARASSRQ